MSNCAKGGRLTYLPPEPPTLKRLAELNGEPPWELEVPVPDMLPPEGVDFIGAVTMGGARFERVLECELEEEFAYNGRKIARCSACAHEFDDYEQRAAAYCMVCGARLKGDES